MRKGETLIDTAITLNAMHPDIIVVRHHASGAVELLARKVDCSVINAGDGSHEHPTQALLDALTIRRNKGRIEGLLVAICGDILHSRVARSNIILLNAMESDFGSEKDRWDVFRSLATLAYVKYRDPYFRNELIVAMRIMQDNRITREKMVSSWAGAMGQTQFMKTARHWQSGW